MPISGTIKSKNMKPILAILNLSLLLSSLFSCKNSTTETGNSETAPRIPVKTTVVVAGKIDNVISLNGKTVYLRKNAVVSSIPGYISKVNIQYGDQVRKNQLLFEIQTRENKAIENSGIETEINTGNHGIICIKSPSDGIIGELNVSASGIYVAEGTQLCNLVESQDVMVQVNVPFEFNQMIRLNQGCRITLPDSTTMNGSITRIIPEINEVSQTQNVLIKILGGRQLPENLNVQAQFIRSTHLNAMLIPKEALLTNEVQNDFWVIKILNDSLALKIPVRRGFENQNMVEIISERLSVNDIVIIEGAYGLADSTIVKIVK